jgi:hypothetical protein
MNYYTKDPSFRFCISWKNQSVKNDWGRDVTRYLSAISSLSLGH